MLRIYLVEYEVNESGEWEKLPPVAELPEAMQQASANAQKVARKARGPEFNVTYTKRFRDSGVQDNPNVPLQTIGESTARFVWSEGQPMYVRSRITAMSIVRLVV